MKQSPLLKAAPLAAFVLLAVLASSAEAQTYRKKWTTTADFGQGAAVNVNATEVPDQLQLNLGNIETPYLWVSNSGSSTVSRISTVSGRVLSVTDITQNLPNGVVQGIGPSRTAVDLDFNCWVSLRYDTNGRAFRLSAANGAITGVTDYVGSNTRGVAINSNNDVWISSSQVGAQGQYGWMKIRPRTQTFQTNILQTFQNPEPSYGLTIDPYNRVFSTTSWLDGRKAVQRVNGETGAIEQTWTLNNLNQARIYGVSTDIDGDLWGTYWRDNTTGQAEDSLNLMRLDGDYQCPNGAATCAISQGNGILQNINVQSVIMAAGGGAGPYGGRGVAVDANGFVWAVFNDIPAGQNPQTSWQTAPSYAVKVDRVTGVPILAVPTGIGTVGITPDARGFIWVVNYNGGGANYQDFPCPNGENGALGGTVSKLRSSDGSVVATYPTCGSEPYTYSDMAGYNLRSVTLRSGNWRVVHDSGRENLEWETLSWLGNVPEGGQLRVRVRVANTEAGLANATFVDMVNGGDIPGTGRWLEAEVFFFTRNDFIGPVLEELSVSSVCIAAPETCDGFDNNCNGQIDDGNPGGGQACATGLVGVCSVGEQRCLNGAYQCVAVTAPGVEVCDGQDNNCDGRVDEGVANLCGGCGPVPQEACDGDDNDCDGRIDEGVANLCGGCGAVPQEACDGDDNDCDGLIDEGVSNLCGTCGAVPQETCNTSDDDCDGLVDEGVVNRCGACGPNPEEICNGLDDDCDGVPDNGVLNACGECGPTPEEICNGLDDDCDGETDEEVLNACGTCGEVAADTCNGVDDDCDGAVDEGVANRCGSCGEEPEEVCDGIDNDCDGETDENVKNACGTCGILPTEVCDGTDNDCDGQVDEGETNACGTCGELGPDLCDGLDNDCDGQLDENPECVAGRTCIQGECAERCAAGECPAGFYCAPDGFCLVDRCVGRICPPAEVCVDGDCTADPACRGVECGADTICVEGQCVADPCDGVTCEPGQSCWRGTCEYSSITACRGVSCSSGQVCQDGACVEDPCNGVTCDPGQRCEGGLCEDACADIVCNTGFICRLGACVLDQCFGVQCPESQVCYEGNCIFEACVEQTCPEGQQCGRNGCEPTGSCGGTFCADDQQCVNGVCVGGEEPDAGEPTPTEPEPNSFAAGGGNPFSCSTTPGAASWPWGVAGVLGSLLGAAALWRRR